MVCVSGLLRMYDLYFRQIYEMELLAEFHGDTTVTECHFYGNGVACMTSEGTIRVVEVSDDGLCLLWRWIGNAVHA